jgi:hypothetical protein
MELVLSSAAADSSSAAAAAAAADSSSADPAAANRVSIGPLDDGTFVSTVALSDHIARMFTTHISSGQSATLALLVQWRQHQQHCSQNS